MKKLIITLLASVLSLTPAFAENPSTYSSSAGSPTWPA